jgi:hypothetical protein
MAQNINQKTQILNDNHSDLMQKGVESPAAPGERTATKSAIADVRNLWNQ